MTETTTDATPTTPQGRLLEIHRFPVKSMQGEQLDAAAIAPTGVLGDRAWAVVDDADGTVASAKRPRRWGRLLDARATFASPPTPEQPAPPVRIELPDGTEVRSDDADVHDVLSRYLGRPVHLTHERRPEQAFHEVWPDDVGAIAPDEFMAQTAAGAPDEGGADRMSAIGVAALAPGGGFVDLTPLHVLTTATLAAIERQAPGSVVDVRRYRPNLLVEVVGPDGRVPADFVENEWAGRTVDVGDVAVQGVIPTMRCVMTTLAQGDLPEDRQPLRALADVNRLEIPGLGRWACAGLYASVGREGHVRVGDPVAVR
ncbi:MOSC domain-containing protein [Actinomarinicola tropica]|uniref:MOSC domain-containing protein n=1 Tax=Actinomarinicola tropica TaxID=2789776 RepID=A0A5Q2RLT0_9ACTN|nr:MOSC N-terminal beta barrel domain-containing protein [Actinomarinicola tropica]QGG95037.1 MOSC domain-containing protein [Actinomarinicola tropica]